MIFYDALKNYGITIKEKKIVELKGHEISERNKRTGIMKC